MNSQPHDNPAQKKINLRQVGLIFLLLTIIISGIFYLSNSSLAAKNQHIDINPAFAAYISAYTAGVISKESAIRIRFARDVQDSTQIGKEVERGLLKFNPGIDGAAYWIDARTIEFKPTQWLPSGKHYRISFKLASIMEVPDNLSDFEFDFTTMEQNFEVSFAGLNVYDKNDLKRQQISGQLQTADAASEEEVKKILTATQNDQPLTILWEHQSDNKTHDFTIEEIIRGETANNIHVMWDGKPVSIDKKGDQMIEVPALGDFKLLSTRVVQTPEQYVSLQFSDPIKEKQNLNGLITLSKTGDLNYIIEDNEIRVYPPVRQTGTKSLTIHPGIQNILSFKMQSTSTYDLVFEQLKPSVRLVGNGVVLPSTEGMVLPFEAVSLQAVQVQITRIYENNILQFFQNNEISGNNEIRRVGKPMLKKTISLKNQGITDLGKWNRFTLDLQTLIAAEPGAIYQVQLSFRQQHIQYSCPDSPEPTGNLTSLELDNWEDTTLDEFSYWDGYEDYYDYNYQWEERDNPCHASYYAYGRPNVIKNILASDLGMIAKIGNNQHLDVAVTDLKTTNPLNGINVDIYDYQQQLIESLITDHDGFVSIDLKKKPFTIVAKRNTERGYLKVDDGNSLSLSNFDVSGKVIQKGLKGFIYGERGVWRPGDDIYLTFILEDPEKKLPDDHPVIFELLNPRGQSKQKIINNKATGGMYQFTTSTGPDDLTGNWIANIKVGGATFTKQLKIESIKPNRLKINLDFGKDKIVKGNANLTGDLSVKWLHGAPARGLKAEFDVILSQTTTSFDGYANYTFDDPSREFYSESQKIYEGTLNDQGNAVMTATLDTDYDPPGMLMAHFRGKVYEQGGGFSIDKFSIPFSSYSSYIGLQTPRGDRARGMLLTDTLHNVQIVTIDATGKPVSRTGVKVELYKLNWRWWWDQSAQNIANYIGSTATRAIQVGTINTNNGKGDWEFKVNYPDWGRFFVRVCDPVSGHCAGKIIYMDWPGWAGRAQKEFPGGASMLNFTTDKEIYRVGEDVKVNIPGNSEGRALVSIENGSGVLEKHWVKTSKGESSFIFNVKKEMTPNVFVSISLLQPHGQTANDLPIRLYGIKSIKIDDPGTHLEPVIEMPDELAPESEVSIKITEKNGKPMAYTVAIVDEGLLDLTRFETPDAWQSFYAREALGVKTWDIYDEVIGAYGGKLERLIAIGGDGSASQEENAKVNRFKPVVKHFGPFFLEGGKSQNHRFTMPQYIGSVKTMVVAANNGAYGKADMTTPVRQSLMVLGTLPRVLGPGESVYLPANVFVSDNSISNVQVGVKANQLFEIQEPESKALNFNGPSDAVVDFMLKIKPALGAGKVNITAKSGSNTSQHTIDILVRNPNPPVTNIIEKVIPAGETWNTGFENAGMPGTNKATLEIYNIPPINLEKRMRYLLRYPHGCIEQTVSAAFPQLFMADITDINQSGQQLIQQNITAAITRLQSFQNREGGFSYWPGENYIDPWSSSYTGHFLLEAEKKGYQVPHELLRKWKQYQRSQARSWKKLPNQSRSDLEQAYRLYVLALGNTPEKGAMNRLRESSTLSNAGKWRLAAAYVLIGQEEAAKQLIQNESMEVAPYQELSFTYGSHVRDEAMMLETLCLLNEKEKSFMLMKKISAHLSNDNYWMSTQTTSFSLIAASKYIAQEKPQGGIKFSYKLNELTPINAETDLSIAQKVLAVEKLKSGNLQVDNKNNHQLYARIVLEGIPLIGDQTSAENNLRLNIVYKSSDGNIINPEKLLQGTNFIAEVTVSNPGFRGNYQALALTQIFPTGWEIINTRLDGIDYPGKYDKPNYQDIKDDRVYTYFNLDAHKRKTFRVMLNATYAGKFYLPTIACEAMYDHTISARQPGKWIEVSKPGVQ